MVSAAREIGIMFPAALDGDGFHLPLEPTDSPHFRDNENYLVGGSLNYKAYKWADRTW